MKYFPTVFIISVLTILSLHAQKRPLNRFNAGVVVGINTSQINGDHLSGYDKFGFFTGIRATANLNTNAELVVEMQFIRKGSTDPDQFVAGEKRSRFIALDYIEVPILYHHKIESKVGKIGLEAGIAFGRLFGFRINENANTINYTTFSSKQEEFKKNELALIMGSGIFVNEQIRVMGRFNYSLTLFYENENPTIDVAGDIPSINDLRNLYLSLGVNYIF